MKKTLIFALLCIFAITTLSACFGGIEAPATEPTEEATQAQPTEAPLPAWPTVEGMISDDLVSEPNTSERVDEIARLAKAFANDGTDSFVRATEAIDYIRAMHGDLFRSNKVMEHAMFMGYYLDYLYPDDMVQSELGFDTYRAIKYVYRGAETIEDAAYALEDIREDLARIDGE